MKFKKKISNISLALWDLASHLITFYEVRSVFIAALSSYYLYLQKYSSEHWTAHPNLVFWGTFILASIYYGLRGVKGRRYHYFESGTIEMLNGEKAIVVSTDTTRPVVGGYIYFIKIKYDHPMRLIPTITVKNIQCSAGAKNVEWKAEIVEKNYATISITLRTGIVTNIAVPPCPIQKFEYEIDSEDNEVPKWIKWIFVVTKDEGWITPQLIKLLRLK